MGQAWLYDGRSAARRLVTVEIADGQLKLADENGVALDRWDIATLRRSDIDAPGDAATLRRANGPERVFIADAGVLADLRAAGAKLGSSARWTRLRWLGFGGAFVASVGIAAILVDELPSLAVPFVPRRVERAWSEGIEAALVGSLGRCTGPAGEAALGRLTARLAAASGLDTPPHFSVLDTGQINAFTLPDGRILILRGLIDNASDANEVSGVMAHEMGHAVHRDPSREMIRSLELNMLARSPGRGGGIASQMTSLSYGRRAESAADASALETLRRAGLDASGLGRFLAGLPGQADSGTLPSFLSDHPSSASRAERLRVPSSGVAAMTAEEWRDVKGICAK